MSLLPPAVESTMSDREKHDIVRLGIGNMVSHYSTPASGPASQTPVAKELFKKGEKYAATCVALLNDLNRCIAEESEESEDADDGEDVEDDTEENADENGQYVGMSKMLLDDVVMYYCFARGSM